MAEKLDTYNKKRRFDKTDEPRGDKASPSDSNLRFVVQHHIASRDHYDLRLEWDGVLKSWAVPKGPSFNSGDKRLAVNVEDHPLEYRTFEGTIPEGEYGGGTVMIWDEGRWEPLEDPEEAFSHGSFKFELYGQRLKGRWVLVHMRPKEGEKDKNWLLIKERDKYAGSANIADYTTSVVSGRTMEEIAAGKQPKKKK